MKAKIRADLEKLHEQIQWLDDAASRRAMNDLVSDIEKHLAAGEEPVGDITSQLETAVTRFEAGHPKLAVILKNVLDTLGNMGI